MPRLFKTVELRERSSLEKADSIAITTDPWTSSGTENYVAVTAHFINNEWKVENYTLGTKKFNETHTSENLSKGLQGTIDRWKLNRNDKGPAVSTDNASNTVKAVKEAGLFPHITCFANTINLVTKRGLKVPLVEESEKSCFIFP